MSEPQSTAASPPPRRTIAWLSLLQFAFSALAAVSLLGLALSSAVLGLVRLMDPEVTSTEATETLMAAATFGLVGLLMVPSVVYGLAGVLGRKLAVPAWMARLGVWLRPSRLILLFPLVLVGGYFLGEVRAIAWLFMPPLHLLAVILPIAWLVWLGARGLSAGSPQRFWGAVATGTVLAPGFALVLEIMVMALYAILAALFVASSPDLAQQLEILTWRIQLIDPTDQADVARLLAPFFSRPEVILGMLSFMSAVVPLIEELFKPIGVWLLAGRKLTPASGFVAGIVSGAGFALFETLTAANTTEDWALLMVIRVGTAVMHILTTGLMGWALGMAFAEKRWLRLGASYFLAVTLHGLWNAAAILMSLGSLPTVGNVKRLIPEHAEVTGAIFLLLFALLAFSSLLLYNRRLRRQAAAPPGLQETPL